MQNFIPNNCRSFLKALFRLSFFITLFALIHHTSASAQIVIDSIRPILIDYTSPTWNQKPNSNEIHAILFRDGKSGKMARVLMTETGNNTGVFHATYNISWGTQEISPELYIVSEDLLKSAEQMKKIEKNIADGTLFRKSTFVRGNAKGQNLITIYDTKEQALKAFEDYQKIRVNKPPVDPAALEAQANAKLELERKMRLENSLKSEVARSVLEKDLRGKIANDKSKYQQLNPAEKAKNNQRAKEIAAEGMKLYQAEKYTESEKKFEQAASLNPTDPSYYFQYGVCLYRNEKYSQSIVVLRVAEGPNVNAVEKEYYQGLDYFKMKDLESAQKHFINVKAKNDKSLSPSSSFFSGIINFQKENYDGAKSDFEYVLDQSSDPALDKQAEAYIEQIANAMAFKKEQSKKYLVTLTAGVMYDSNVSSTGRTLMSALTTDAYGIHDSLSGTLEYRPVYTQKHEASISLSASNSWSHEVDFDANKTFQNADPLVIDIAVPYKYKGLLFGKGYQMGAKFTLESIDMNADAKGDPERVIESKIFANDHTFVMSENWFSTYAIELRRDESKLTLTDTNDDASANKISLTTTQIFFQNQKKTEAWIGNFGLSRNSADGKNVNFNRYDIGATYMMPGVWDTTWTANLAYYNVVYPDISSNRADSDYASTVSVRKPINESLAASITASYAMNVSNVPANDYDKYFILTNLTYTGAF